MTWKIKLEHALGFAQFWGTNKTQSHRSDWDKLSESIEKIYSIYRNYWNIFCSFLRTLKKITKSISAIFGDLFLTVSHQKRFYSINFFIQSWLKKILLRRKNRRWNKIFLKYFSKVIWFVCWRRISVSPRAHENHHKSIKIFTFSFKNNLGAWSPSKKSLFLVFL